MRLLVVSILFCFKLVAQQAIISLDTNEILIGEQVVLHVNLSSGNSYKWVEYKLNEEVNYLQDNIEILSVSDIDTLFDGDLPKYQQELLLTSFDTGYYVIRPFSFASIDSEDSLKSNALLLRVNYPEIVGNTGDQEDINDIKAQIDKPFKVSELLVYWWIVLVIILLIVAFKIWNKWRKKPKPVVQAPKVIIPAHIVALEKIESLKSEKAWTSLNQIVYFTDLSYIIREYLEKRYFFQALENTTTEISKELEGKVEAEMQVTLSNILMDLDLAKFAKSPFSEQESLDALVQIEEWINKTKEVSLEN